MQIDIKTNFDGFMKALSKKPDEVIEMVKQSGLTGRGGAHFPTGLKWEFTRKASGENKVIICNADEGEPGTFKDKYIITNNPERIIEGIAIAAYAIGAERAYIYLRAEYDELKKNLDDAIQKYSKELEKIKLQLDVFMGSGAYICGDETAIMNSIEGKRGEPRSKPPYPAEYGVFGLPTCINNVETLSNVPLIILNKWENKALFSLSGNLKTPGVYELPLGITAGELIKLGNPEKKIKALFFGCAGGCIPYDENTKLDVETIKSMGAMLGSCTVIAVDEDHSIPDVCKNISEFFVHESCGKCTPCRDGNVLILGLVNDSLEGNMDKAKLEDLEQLANFVNKTSFCGLGMASNTHILTALKYFKSEFQK